MQAAAAGVEPDARMNPVLLKPGASGSQVVVMGHPDGDVDALSYPARKAALLDVALDALASLRRDFDVVICEGAGSPAEINLRATDIANLGLARAAGLPALVVTDIDRGGAFAALYGTVALLEPADQALIAGFVINKFRGARELLDPGLEMITALTGRPVLGVLPWAEGLRLDAEDSLALDTLGPDSGGAPAGGDVLRVSVVRLPRISNFTDADALAAEPGVLVRLATRPAELADADLVVLPGSRATVADLGWLRARGLAAAVAARAAAGRPVLGICGGFQMLAGRDRGPGRVEGRDRGRAGPAARPRAVRRGQDAGPPVRLGAGRPGDRLRDPARRCHHHRRAAVPRRLPGRDGVGHQLARHDGERRVPAGLPGRGSGRGRAGLPARARYAASRRCARLSWTGSGTWSLTISTRPRSAS